MFLTMVLAFVTIVSSAQFMVVTTIDQPEENAEWEMSNITDNIGIGYILTDEIVAGLVKNGEKYDLWGRYHFSNCYAAIQAPTEETTDNVTLGIGYSMKVWKDLYVDPSYMMSTKEDSEGEFKLGISYRF